MGARVITGARVTSIVDEAFDPDAACVVLTVEGTGVAGGRARVRARRVVHCTNSAAAALLPQLRGRIVPVRNHLVATAPLPPLAGTEGGGGGGGGCGFGVYPGWVYGSQRADGIVVIGGFRNAAPAKGVGAAIDSGCGHESLAPDGFHADARAAARAFVRDRLPSAATITHEWTGVIGWSEDNLPWVGAVPGRPAHLVCAGFSGHGMAQTFLCGAAVAHIARTGEFLLFTVTFYANHAHNLTRSP